MPYAKIHELGVLASSSDTQEAEAGGCLNQEPQASLGNIVRPPSQKKL